VAPEVPLGLTSSLAETLGVSLVVPFLYSAMGQLAEASAVERPARSLVPESGVRIRRRKPGTDLEDPSARFW
jgi:hypothetical protein